VSSCADGLECVFNTSFSLFDDIEVRGVCQAPAPAGGFCSQFPSSVHFPDDDGCEAGLVCLNQICIAP
jgi:hypothetical protein